MPTITVTATGRRSGPTADIRVELADGRMLTRTVTWAKIDTPEKFAAWLLTQSPDGGVEEATLRRAFTITFRVDSVIDADTGATVPLRVLESVTTANLLEDTAWALLAASQLGQVTTAEALAIVDAATTVAQLRAVVRGLVQVVIPMRDVVRRLRELRRP